jgi:hypothetical protein
MQAEWPASADPDPPASPRFSVDAGGDDVCSPHRAALARPTGAAARQGSHKVRGGGGGGGVVRVCVCATGGEAAAV